MKILIADRTSARGAALAAQLGAEIDDFMITVLQDGENLADAVRDTEPDVIIVDMDRADRDGLDSMRSSNAGQPPIVMFMDEDDPGFMQQAIAAGVSSYHGKNVPPRATRLIMQLALEYFQRAEKANSRLAEIEAQARAKQNVDTAKRMLMMEDKMSEPAAHRFLQRRAMDQQKRVAEVAAELLASRGKQNG